jgi:hypothetical protein
MNGGFKIIPDPPVAGQPVEIQYSGTDSQIAWQVDGGDLIKVNVPANKKIRIDPLPSGLVLIVVGGVGEGGIWNIEEIRG